MYTKIIIKPPPILQKYVSTREEHRKKIDVLGTDTIKNCHKLSSPESSLRWRFECKRFLTLDPRDQHVGMGG